MRSAVQRKNFSREAAKNAKRRRPFFGAKRQSAFACAFGASDGFGLFAFFTALRETSCSDAAPS
jgi:hypothetical protein